MDVFITTLSNETYPLYRNNGDLSFTYVTQRTGVGQISVLYSGWGARFADFDNDGRRDLFVAQGHVLDTIEQTTTYLKYRQTPLLMLNVGTTKAGASFADVSATAGAPFQLPLAARGAAVGDLDNDGDEDIVVAQTDGPALVLRNNGGTRNHWIGLALGALRVRRARRRHRRGRAQADLRRVERGQLPLLARPAPARRPRRVGRRAVRRDSLARRSEADDHEPADRPLPLGEGALAGEARAGRDRMKSEEIERSNEVGRDREIE
jgi:hypothetical protein